MPRVCAVRLMRCGGRRMGEALAGAPLDNAPKEYPPKIQQLVRDIASLTLLEISDLNELLKVSQPGPCPVSALGGERRPAEARSPSARAAPGLWCGCV